MAPQVSAFLSREELVELTGYRQPSRQLAHLRTQRIPFHVNRAGHPVVARSVISGPQKAKPAWSPSWAGDQP